MTLEPHCAFVIFYGFSSIYVHDLRFPCTDYKWTEAHRRQGFLRKRSEAIFCTIGDSGSAQCRVFLEKYYEALPYTRVISIPFFVESGKLAISEAEDAPTTYFPVPIGSYRMSLCQILLDDNHSRFDMFLKATPELESESRIVVADSGLRARVTISWLVFPVRNNSVVPVAMEIRWHETDGSKFLVADFDARGVLSSIELGSNFQPLLGRGRGDQVDYDIAI
jgi:hypothetical protein